MRMHNFGIENKIKYILLGKFSHFDLIKSECFLCETPKWKTADKFCIRIF